MVPLNTQTPHNDGLDQPAKIAPYNVFSAKAVESLDLHQRLLHDTAGHYVGPMPVRMFLAEFMPWQLTPIIPTAQRCEMLAAAATASSEAEMNATLVSPWLIDATYLLHI